MQNQTTVTAYLISEQLLLFAVAYAQANNRNYLFE